MKSTKSIRSRREFLKGASFAAAGAGVAVAASKSVSAKSLERHKDNAYHETKHVKTYYELAKF